MIEHGMYFGTEKLYELIKTLGGEWNDVKQRPIVCLVKFSEEELYWAIPVGNWEHRDDNAKKRITEFLDKPENDLRSCYYHIGKTDVMSIFFISDAIPVTDLYVEREYVGKYTNRIHIIKIRDYYRN